MKVLIKCGSYCSLLVTTNFTQSLQLMFAVGTCMLYVSLHMKSRELATSLHMHILLGDHPAFAITWFSG